MRTRACNSITCGLNFLDGSDFFAILDGVGDSFVNDLFLLLFSISAKILIHIQFVLNAYSMRIWMIKSEFSKYSIPETPFSLSLRICMTTKMTNLIVTKSHAIIIVLYSNMHRNSNARLLEKLFRRQRMMKIVCELGSVKHFNGMEL